MKTLWPLPDSAVIYCNQCEHPRGPISQSEHPIAVFEKYVNDGAAVRCGVCGSSDVRPIIRFED